MSYVQNRYMYEEMEIEDYEVYSQLALKNGHLTLKCK